MTDLISKYRIHNEFSFEAFKEHLFEIVRVYYSVLVWE